tara:strand:- start:3745 stop:4365 length:621 start_codon:yes stop_codon:yes gene_type:complete
MKSITLIIKSISTDILRFLKFIVSKFTQFAKWIWQSLKKLIKWIHRPKVYKLISGTLSILLFIYFSWYLYFKPKIDIDFTDPLDSRDVSTSIFSVVNNGESNIYDVMVNYKIVKLDQPPLYIENSIAENTIPKISRIKANSEQTVLINLVDNNAMSFKGFDFKTVEGELYIYLKYKYWQKQVTNYDTLHFKASKMVKNKIVWTKIQ